MDGGLVDLTKEQAPFPTSNEPIGAELSADIVDMLNDDADETSSSSSSNDNPQSRHVAQHDVIEIHDDDDDDKDEKVQVMENNLNANKRSYVDASLSKEKPTNNNKKRKRELNVARSTPELQQQNCHVLEQAGPFETRRRTPSPPLWHSSNFTCWPSINLDGEIARRRQSAVSTNDAVGKRKAEVSSTREGAVSPVMSNPLPLPVAEPPLKPVAAAAVDSTAARRNPIVKQEPETETSKTFDTLAAGEPNFILIDSSDDEEEEEEVEILEAPDFFMSTESITGSTRQSEPAMDDGTQPPPLRETGQQQAGESSSSSTSSSKRPWRRQRRATSPMWFPAGGYSKYKFKAEKHFNYKKSRGDALREQERLFRKAAEKVRSQGFQRGQAAWRNYAMRINTAITGPTFTRPMEDLNKLNVNHWKWSDVHSRLGLPRDATTRVVTQQYRRMARVYHPDKCKDAGRDTTSRFQAITEAYHILTGR